MTANVRVSMSLIVLGFCWTVSSFADDLGYWSIKLPVPESATNATTDIDRLFMVKSVSFGWEGEDTSELRDFYAEYFKSIGWEDPFADRSMSSGMNNSGWSSFAMNFDEQNMPFANYGTMWKATEYPAMGAVTLHLTGFAGGKFKGSAVVQIAPEVDTEASFRLLSLLGDDPRNLFKLHAAVNGNPFELHTIALPANYREESDPLLAEYYQIVDEIILEYRKWEREYVLD